MAQHEDPTTTRTTDVSPGVHIAPETPSQVPVIKGSIDDFIKRREEVAAADHEEFRTYLVEKQQLEARKKQRETVAVEDPIAHGKAIRRLARRIRELQSLKTRH